MNKISVNISFDGECDYIPSEEEIARQVEDAMLQLDIDGVAVVMYEME